VLGLGNVLMGDEGIGVYVVRALEQHKLPPNVECLDGGTGGFTLLEPLQTPTASSSSTRQPTATR
jgi:hydrogenase maturation protease